MAYYNNNNNKKKRRKAAMKHKRCFISLKIKHSMEQKCFKKKKKNVPIVEPPNGLQDMLLMKLLLLMYMLSHNEQTTIQICVEKPRRLFPSFKEIYIARTSGTP